MKKKGFTLIELLAVIVILAVIALISMPLVLNTIDKAKKGAAIESANGIISAAENKYMSSMTEGKQETKFDFPSDTKLSFKGTRPTNGTVEVDKDGNINAILEINGYCIEKKFEDQTPKVIEKSPCVEESDLLSDKVKLGDYISMTPTSTSYTTDSSKNSENNDPQTINPSELNLWRVIRINDDGTIEMVSEYVSSEEIYFEGITGYKNFVGYLNVIASQYTNTKYVQSTRHMGYNGQIEYITDTSKLTSTTAPWTCSTGGSCNLIESLGGGDMLYTTDTELVKSVLGTLKANAVGTTSATDYWLASRYFKYVDSNQWLYYGKYVSSSGNLKYSASLIDHYQGFYENDVWKKVRPILTLKSGLKAAGSGTSEDPYVLP